MSRFKHTSSLLVAAAELAVGLGVLVTAVSLLGREPDTTAQPPLYYPGGISAVEAYGPRGYVVGVEPALFQRPQAYCPRQEGPKLIIAQAI